MNAEVERIVGEYEELWRAAALRNHPQVHFPANGDIEFSGGGGEYAPDRTCAFILPSVLDKELYTKTPLFRATQALPLDWACPKCGALKTTLGVAMIHLNNEHRWTWDVFANKFRDALAQGIARAEVRS